MHKKKIMMMTGLLVMTMMAPAFANSDPAVMTTTNSAISVQTEPAKTVEKVEETQLRKEARTYLASFKTIAKGSEISVASQKQVLKAFDALAKKGDLSGAAIFVDKKISGLSPVNADELIIRYHQMLSKALYMQPVKDGLEKKTVMDALAKLAVPYHYDYYKLTENRSKVKDVKIRALLQSIESRNLRLVNSEGMFFYAPNYINLAKYSSCTSPEMAAFLKFSAMQTFQPSSSDGGLIVSEREMARRIVVGDELLKNYKGTPLEKYVAIMQIEQMRSLMYGLDNSPAYEYDSMHYKKEILEAYQMLAAEKEGQVGSFFAEQLKLVSKHKFIAEDSAIKEVGTLVAKIEKVYGIKANDQKNLINKLYGIR